MVQQWPVRVPLLLLVVVVVDTDEKVIYKT